LDLPDAKVINQIAFSYPVEYDKRIKSLPRRPESLTFDEFSTIALWKSSRIKSHINSDHNREEVQSVTREAFAYLADVNDDSVMEQSGDMNEGAGLDVWKAVDTLRYEKGNGLKGVQVRVASAILMAYDPTQFTVMDWRAWSVLNKYQVIDSHIYGYFRGIEDDKEYAQALNSYLNRADTYVHYLQTCRDIAKNRGVSLRNLDRFLFVLGGAGCLHDEYLQNREQEGLI